MFTWSKRRKYRAEVIGTMMASLATIERQDEKTFLRSYPGIEDAISSGFTEGRDTDELGFEVAAVVLTDIIEKNDDREWRDRVLHQINDRISHPDWHHSLVRKQTVTGTYPKALEDFVWRVEWFIAMVLQYGDRSSDAHGFAKMVILDVLGALRGLSSEDRRAERIIDALDEALFPSEE